jgi:hypothetical protein
MAGAAKMPLRTFVRFDAIGAALWASLHTTFGYLIGSGYPFVRRYVGLAGVVALLALALGVGWSVGLFARGRSTPAGDGPGRSDAAAGSISSDDSDDHRREGDGRRDPP